MRRNSKGQSMVEYALGLGCVAAVCMAALGALGHMSGDIIFNVQSAINYGGSRPSDIGNTVNSTATPWSIN